ncbi:hypothetical protein RRG08_056265 [Elysia crispata]|uniref:Uncharacterized protein n=1 Tax=Elysia crispata TaxID=231223 RepID=A0AAE1AWJ6_9GAST|nr:hypothetical protein RRG08_056265 [Elysia crispata]
MFYLEIQDLYKLRRATQCEQGLSEELTPTPRCFFSVLQRSFRSHICELGATLTTAGVDTVTDGATSSRAHGSLGLAQSTEETCQFTGLLGKSALAATGVCAGTGVGISHEGDHGQCNSGSEGVHDDVA